MAGPSHFSTELTGEQFVEGELHLASPFRACEELNNVADMKGKIMVAERGDCTFVSKARRAEAAGALALIVADNVVGSSGETQPMFAMSGDGTDNVQIPVVFMYWQEFSKLKTVMQRKENRLSVRIMQMLEFKRWQQAKEAKLNQTLATAEKNKNENTANNQKAAKDEL